MTYIVQLFTGAAGSVAFGILFHMKKKHLPLAALGGFLGWLLFIICRGFWGGMSIAWAICDFLRKIRGKQEIS